MLKPLSAFCAKDLWTVIQSRGQFGNPEVYFYRKWDDYEKGFGVPGIAVQCNYGRTTIGIIYAWLGFNCSCLFFPFLDMGVKYQKAKILLFWITHL